MALIGPVFTSTRAYAAVNRLIMVMQTSSFINKTLFLNFSNVLLLIFSSNKNGFIYYAVNRYIWTYCLSIFVFEIRFLIFYPPIFKIIESTYVIMKLNNLETNIVNIFLTLGNFKSIRKFLVTFINLKLHLHLYIKALFDKPINPSFVFF